MSISTIYIILFALSLICSGIYFWRWHKHIDIAFTMIYMIIPLVQCGYVLFSFAKDLGAVITSLQIIYLGGIFLQPIITLNIFNLCRIKLPRIVSFIMGVFSTIIFISIMMIGHNGLFYKTAKLINLGGYNILEKEYGIMHTIFIIWVIFLFTISLAALMFARWKIPEASIKTIVLLFITEMLTVISYLFIKRVFKVFEPISIAYTISSVFYLIIVDRISLYDVDDTVIDSVLEQGEIGYISFDFSHNYLGSTNMAKKLLPQLSVAQVDRHLKNEQLFDITEKYMNDFEKDQVSKDHYYEYNGKIYLMRVSFLYDGIRRRGYQFEVSDDTRHQNYLKSIEDYNRNLRTELSKKTRMLEKKGYS